MGTSPVRPRFVWCGFGIVTAWEDGLTPRYLFAKLLERLSINSDTPNKSAGTRERPVLRFRTPHNNRTLARSG